MPTAAGTETVLAHEFHDDHTPHVPTFSDKNLEMCFS